MKNILITGKSGVVGTGLFESLKSKNLDFKLFTPAHSELDVSSKNELLKYIEKNKIDTIIHLAAIRDVVLAESERGNKKGKTWSVNVKAVKYLSTISNKFGAKLIYISTDMVFSGNQDKKGPYTEDDEPAESLRSLSWYGWTKRLGEKEISRTNNGVIIRIGNVTLHSLDPKADYLGKILWLHNNNKLYPMFNDQQLTLTYIPDLVQLLLFLIKESQISGTYHISSSNHFTPHELANYLLEKVTNKKDLVPSGSIDEYLKKFPKRYPKYGGLHSVYTSRKVGIEQKKWQEIVDLFVQSISRKKVL